MLEAALEGLMMGLLLSLLLGPAFFLLIETSINKGIRAALEVDAGIVLSDIFWITALYLGAAGFIKGFLDSVYTYIIGSIVFIVFGLFFLFSSKDMPEIYPKRSSGRNFFKGFLLNSLNPSVPLFWLGVVSVAALEHSDNFVHGMVFFSSAIITVLITDVLKIVGASKIRHILNHNIRKRIKAITGILLISLGIYFIYKSYSV